MKLPFVSKKRQDSSEPEEDLQQNSDPGAAESQACSESQSVRGLSDLYSPKETSEAHVHDIARVLLDMGKINPKQYKHLRQ